MKTSEHVQSLTTEFRVVFDGGSNYYKLRLRAEEKAAQLARLGVESQLETRDRPGKEWKLIGTFRPRRGGRYEFVDPYAPTVSHVTFDDTSLRGRVIE